MERQRGPRIRTPAVAAQMRATVPAPAAVSPRSEEAPDLARALAADGSAERLRRAAFRPPIPVSALTEGGAGAPLGALQRALTLEKLETQLSGVSSSWPSKNSSNGPPAVPPADAQEERPERGRWEYEAAEGEE